MCPDKPSHGRAQYRHSGGAWRELAITEVERPHALAESLREALDQL